MNAQDIVSLLYKKGIFLDEENGDLLIDISDEALNEELLLLLRRFKPEIILFLQKIKGSGIAELKPTTQNHPATYEAELSAAQRRMLFMEELAHGKSYYNIPVAYRIIGELNKGALIYSLNCLVSRHDILRTSYRWNNNSYVQYINAPTPINIIDVSITKIPNSLDVLQELLDREASYVFKLDQEWPFRVSLIKVDEDENILSINIHHIAADGWSARRIVSEISDAYKRYLGGVQDSFVEPVRDYQYADYVSWQAEWYKTSHYNEAKNYWLNSLKGIPELHGVATDFVRPKIQSVAGDRYSQVLPIVSTTLINNYASTYKTTPFVIFQAIFAAFLARYSNQTDIVFGTVAANRWPLEFIDTIGLFVNTLVLRVKVDSHVSFDELVQQSRQVSERAFYYQQFSFDALVDNLQPARSLGFNPLVQIMLVMQENSTAELLLEGTSVDQLDQHQNVSKFDLALHIKPVDHGYCIEWEYSSSLFTASTIHRMAKHFECLMSSMLQETGKNINDFQLHEGASQNTLSHDFPAPCCLYQLFTRQVLLRSASPAVRDGERSISYKELNERVIGLSHYLAKIGVKCSDRVGVCMEKSAELVIALLAITKIGAVYVPLDPYYPSQRLSWMIEDSAISVLLTCSDLNLPDEVKLISQVVLVDELDIEYPATQNIPSFDNLDIPAYIIYTSGSTGRPKGVAVSHRSLFFSLHANQLHMELNNSDVMPTIGSQAFGVSLLEILLPLMSGGTIKILKKSQITDVDLLVRLTNDVSVLHAVPSLMQQWLEVVKASVQTGPVYPNLRLLLVGGEAVPATLLREITRWRPSIQLLVLYGMTEAAVVCAGYHATEDVIANYCIGKPLLNTRFCILNSYGQEQPIGVPGELYIDSLSLATEYINQPEMTNEKFIPDPLGSGKRLYRTGDHARLLHNGNYEFLGRVDHQLSLRGARIELGEIENVAAQVVGVKKAVASVVDIGPERVLVLYFTINSDVNDQEAFSAQIKSRLVQHLPDYMCPSIIQKLDLFPLNPNGKVDRKNLPFPQLIKSIVEPETDIERQLVEIWCALLHCEQISVTASFFEVGGHSLLTTKLAAKIRAKFEIILPLRVLFEAPSIKQCALFVEAALKERCAKKMIGEADSMENEEWII